MFDRPATPPASLARETHVCAIVVSYRPDLAVLARLLDALTVQAGSVVVVDNATPGSALGNLCAAFSEVQLVSLTENRGLAAGLNIGVARARTLPGASHVLLMDQDSIPEAGMVRALKAALDSRSRNAKVAAVGPHFHDPREPEDAPFVRIRFPFNRLLRCGGGDDAIACDFLITSGCLIPLPVLDAVGGMDDGLFIDNVDLDWCFRATAAGYTLFGVCVARMLHHHGAQRQRIPGLPRGIVVHTPRRLFYMMRNRVLLYRRAYTPKRWIAQDLPRLLAKLLIFALLVSPRRANLRCMLMGLRAGIKGQSTAPPEDA